MIAPLRRRVRKQFHFGEIFIEGGNAGQNEQNSIRWYTSETEKAQVGAARWNVGI